jgi:hypothetical protein
MGLLVLPSMSLRETAWLEVLPQAVDQAIKRDCERLSAM